MCYNVYVRIGNIGCDNVINGNILIAILCLINVAIISSKFFYTKKVNNSETRIYGYLLVAMLAESIFGIILFASMSHAVNHINFFNSLYLASMTVWALLFSLYMIRISENRDSIYNVIKKIFIFLGCVTIACAFLLKREIAFNGNNEFYATGPAILSVYLFSGVCLLVVGFYLIKNRKKISDKRYLPVLVLLLSGILLMVIQGIFPELFLYTPVESYIVFIMYFTIENPDIKMIEQLNFEKERAEKANHAKTEFLSNMSHEIRTPLNAIVGFSQALIEEDIPKHSKEEVGDILMSANSLLEIVNGILDISKIEANKLEIVNTEYNSKKMMKDIVALIQARIGDKPLEFRTYIDTSIPPVLFGDYIRIKQIIINLLTNAVKYTKEGHIDFKVNSIIQNDICRLIISVEDTGIGIKPEDLNKLFHKFQRFELEKNITTEGTGLGLAITKSLIELMNGKIVVQSVYGKGSKFTVALDQRIIPKTEEEMNQCEEKITEQEFFSAAGSKVLVVDDNKINLKVANRLLQDFNVEVTLVSSGQECINSILDGNQYDLILMDDMMPQMTGTQTLQNLKNIHNFNIPVIALTANAISGMREKYLASGFDDYLAKPIDRQELHVLLKKYLRENKKEELPKETIPSSTEESSKNVSYLKENGFDVDHGIELLGDQEMYDMTIEEFLKESETRLPKIQAFKDQKDMPNYAILVHAMKSDSKYLGVQKLADLSYQHEMASKENRIDFVEEHYQELIEEANKTIAIMKNYLGK